MERNNLIKKGTAIAVILLFIGVSVISSTGTIVVKQFDMSTTSGNTLYVGGGGPGNYTNIQDAINDSSDGDIVFVYNGTYPDNVRINKSISLIGENKNNTIIEGGWGTLVYIDADGVLVTGFTIRDCGSYYIGGIHIKYSSDNNTITGNILTENIVCGISVNGDYNTITNNTIRDNMRGIKLQGANNNTIVRNIIDSNNESGIFFTWLRHIRPSNNQINSNNVIKNNIITNNEEGIYTENVNNTLISNNLIAYNKWSGIYAPYHEEFTYKNNTWIENNTISNNNWGIELYESNTSIISGNTIAYCDYGLYLFDCNSSFVHHNNFINNTKQAIEETSYCDECTNQWDNGYPSGGNYWSDYNGSDNYSGPNQDIPGADGIGDTPYNISGNTDSQDRYPLKDPYGNDTLPPITTICLVPTTPDGGNGWYVSDVEITLIAIDDWSGVNVTYYRLNGGLWVTYTELFTVKSDGEHVIEYYSVDNAGNIEDVKSANFKIDQTPPTIDITWELYCENGTWYLIIGVTCDDTTSGVDYVEFYINDGLMFVDNTAPFEIVLTIPSKYSVKGLICGRQFDEQNVSFYALIVKIKQYWRSSYTFSVAVYDLAGNVIKEEIKFDVPPIIKIQLFKRLTFANNYTGRVGIFFINAEFEEGPV